MIYGIFHRGSGLGNQLFRYLAVRNLAMAKGVDFSMINPEGFKGKSFMNIDMGVPNNINFQIEEPSGKVVVEDSIPLWEEKKIVENGIDIRSYDPEYNFVEDGSIIDGEFQDLKYFLFTPQETLMNWLNIKPELLSPFYDEICVIGYRGGEFKNVPELYLPKAYWDEAIKEIRKDKPDIVFKVVTDDPTEAKKLFPDFEVSNEIGDDWTSILNAHYVIMANSSFYILPALLNNVAKKIIAPRYWARRKDKVWALPANYYPKFLYI